MISVKFFCATILLVGVSAMHIQWELEPVEIRELYEYPVNDIDQDFEFQHPSYTTRTRARRQAQGSLTFNGDGSAGVGAKVPLVGNDRNVLSAIGSVNLDDRMKLASKGIGLAFDNANGHGVSVMKETIPGFGSKLTGAGHATLFNNDNHNIGANAFVSRNMPNIPNVPNFNTVGGGLDYTYNNKVGASLGMAHTPFLQRKDYSAMGNLNVFRNPTSTVDFSAGFKKFDSPFPKSGWKPNLGLSFERIF
uniref:Attacin B n=1 Tax=Hyphantria cunea TaxID=39466 RepID=A1E9A9_HYPCU|nr:attacin B [Hyphantria cunea]